MADSDRAEGSWRARPLGAALRLHAGLAMAGAALLAMAACFAALVASHPAHPLTTTADHGWLTVIRHTRDPVLTYAAKILSLVGGPIGGTVVAVAAAAFLWFVRRRQVAAMFLIASLALTSGASQLIKHLVFRPRPPAPLVAADIGSFPSGHVITTLAVGLALAMVLARPHHRRVPLAVVGVATLVMMWCRTYLGAHWLSDTLESIFVSGGIVLTGWAFAGSLVEAERSRTAAGDASAPD